MVVAMAIGKEGHAEKSKEIDDHLVRYYVFSLHLRHGRCALQLTSRPSARNTDTIPTSRNTNILLFIIIYIIIIFLCLCLPYLIFQVNLLTIRA